MNRPQSASGNYAPGPGQYNLRSSFQAEKGISMTPRRPDSAARYRSYTPGPGAYSSRGNPKEKNSPQYSFGTGSRQPMSQTNQVPGPGIYNAKLLKTNAGIWGFGTSNRDSFTRPTTAPGPGTYNYMLKISVGPQYSIVPRREELKGSMQNPGPGTYSFGVEAYKSKDPAWGMGIGTRKPLATTEKTPGPGTYKHKSGLSGPQWGFGSQTRNGKMQNDGVGPGYYDIPSTVAVVPRYNMPNSSRD